LKRKISYRIFFFSEENIQLITEISENASKEYSIEGILEKIVQTWKYLKFEIILHKPNVYKIKYDESIFKSEAREINKKIVVFGMKMIVKRNRRVT
jgi:hypothetical protein